jgi:hypothetical protein
MYVVVSQFQFTLHALDQLFDVSSFVFLYFYKTQANYFVTFQPFNILFIAKIYYETGYTSSNGLDWYSGGAYLECLPETRYSGDFHGFSVSLQANSWIVPQLDHDHFLSYPFQFIIHFI